MGLFPHLTLRSFSGYVLSICVLNMTITTFVLTGRTGEISGITRIIAWGLYNIHITVSSLAFSKPTPLVSINQNLAYESSPTR